jgi:hypothetical protein
MKDIKEIIDIKNAIEEKAIREAEIRALVANMGKW